MDRPAVDSRFDDLVPRWMFVLDRSPAGFVLAVVVTVAAALPLLLADARDQDLRVGPLLALGVVVVAALGGWRPAAASGALAIALYWVFGLPPEGSLALADAASWASLGGMAAFAVGIPLLTRRVQRAVEDVRRLDEQRVRALEEQAALRRQAEDTAEQVQGVLRIAAGVAGAHTRREVAEAVLDGLELPDRPTTASVAIVVDHRLRIIAARGGLPEQVSLLEGLDLSGSRWLDAVLQGEPSFVDDRDSFAVEHPDEGVLRLYRSGSWAAIAFRAHDAVGLLSLHHEQPQHLSACSLYFDLAAELLATGLERAEVEELQQVQLAELQQTLEERDRIARTLSTTLLPPALPRVEGLASSAWLVPASSDEVAGDFYDVFTPPGGGFVAVLGDVCGKGAEAAAVTSLARYAARVASLDEPDPSHVATVANQALQSDMSDLFCTMAIVRGTPDGEHLDVALAGHLQPRLLSAAGVTRIGSFGTALGLAREAPPSTRVRFAVGDLVVLFSDGLIERDPGYGEEELDADLREWTGLSAEAVAQALRERVEATTAHRHDDVAVMVLGRAPS